MHTHVDFVVKWQGNIQDTTAEIFDHLFIRRIKAKKPCVILITGASGEGKSNTGIYLADKMFKREGLDFVNYVRQAVIGGIEDFGPKAKAILNDKELKDCFVIIIDEAAATVNAKDWSSLTNRAVNFISNMSRAIKPLLIIIIAQSLKQVDSQTRQSVNFYMPVTRTYNKPAKAKIYKFYVNERDLEKPKLQKRLVRGYIDYNDNKELIELKDIEFPKVRDEVWDLYKVDMIDSKSKLLEAEFDKLAKHLLEKNDNQQQQRIEALSKYLWSNKYILSNFAKFTKKKWSLKDDFLTAFSVTDLERKDIEKLLQTKVREEKDELNMRGLDDEGSNE
jgi:adenylate kinase family enzyme